MMKIAPVLVFLLGLVSLLPAQETAVAMPNPWNTIREEAIDIQNPERRILPDAYQTFSLDLATMKAILDQAPLRFSEEEKGKVVILDFPIPDGSFEQFRIFYAPIMHPDLAKKYPEIRSFAGQGIDDPTATARFDLTPHGFHAMILSGKHSSVFVDPYAFGNTQYYISYFKKDFRKKDGSTFECHFDEVNDLSDMKFEEEPLDLKVIGDCQLRTYMLALACTGEYAQYHGGTVSSALAAMNTSMTRVNGVYERDAAITMQLVANNDQLVFLNGNTDPYSNNSGSTMLGQNITTCNSVIGSPNYDIGHVFSTGGGGVAYLNSPCTSNKAGGVTGQTMPVGDPFDIDYVCHEMGHQYGGRHTQNNNCNRDNLSSYEPGSASTIMGYAGICSPDVQINSDDYFHVNSLLLMGAFVTGNTGNSCATVTNVGNVGPAANAGADYTIPRGTPFTLTGSASDPDNTGLTYCWEQYNKEAATQPPSPNSTTGPAFRSLDPTTSTSRTLPSWDNIINNTNDTWEVLSNVSRSYNWRLTVRDNNPGAGCTDDDEMIVTVNGSAGPFTVTEPNTAVTWTIGNTATVTWNVASTNASPVNCANVDILLSTDGGNTYPITLAANTPNDGTQTITVPNNATTTARVMVKAAGNIFFDISNVNFTINTGGGGGNCGNWGPGSVTPSSTSAVITWTAQPGATRYAIRYRPVGASTWQKGITTGTTFTLNNLLPGTTYEYRTRTRCGTTWTTWSSFYNFTTASNFGLSENPDFSFDPDKSAYEEANDQEIRLVLQPNPASEYIEIRLMSGKAHSWILIDPQGNAINRGAWNGEVYQLDIAHLPNGLYMVVLLDQTGKPTVQRFVKF